MERYELTNQRTQRANKNKRYVEGYESLMAVAAKAGWTNIRQEVGSTGNTIFVADLAGDRFVTNAMFAVLCK